MLFVKVLFISRRPVMDLSSPLSDSLRLCYCPAMRKVEKIVPRDKPSEVLFLQHMQTDLSVDIDLF